MFYQVGYEALHRQATHSASPWLRCFLLLDQKYRHSVGAPIVICITGAAPNHLTVARRLRFRKGCQFPPLWPLQTNSFSSWFTSVFEEARPHEGYWGRNESSKAQNQKRQESFAAA